MGLLLLSFCVPRLKYTVLQRDLFFRLVFQHIAKQGRLLLHFQLTNLYCSQKQRTDLPKKRQILKGHISLSSLSPIMGTAMRFFFFVGIAFFESFCFCWLSLLCVHGEREDGLRGSGLAKVRSHGVF